MRYGTVFALCGLAIAPTEAEGRTADVAPQVVATLPATGSSVPAGMREIRATFSQPMSRSGMSVTQIEGCAVPTPSGPPRFSPDGRQFILPVRLRAGTLYCVSFNSDKFKNFRNVQGVSARPYVLRFATAR